MIKNPKKYIGYNDADRRLAFAKHLHTTVLAPAATVQAALQQGACAPDSLLAFEDANNLAAAAYHNIENGFAYNTDGSATVAVLTLMPNITPPMWAWWFGWHGSSDARYKLWHPQAHLSAVWQDGRTDEAYIGRVSQIQEYIGGKLEKANIRFFDPKILGFAPEIVENTAENVFICARLGYTNFPLDFGYLVHHIRATPQGAEMRSRFWIGGKHIAIRKTGIFWTFISTILQKIYRLPSSQATDLMTHCGEEMPHLAKILPDLYNEFGGG